jgi:DNA-binding Lrp family transcriptional regulator
MGRNQKAIDENFLFDALQAGVARKELATMLGISTQTLSARIANLQEKQGLLLQYRNIQALQLTEMQARILEAITPDKIEEAPLKDLVLCYKVLKDKELVTEGKPSEIKGLVSYLVHLEKEQLACEATVTVPAKATFDDADVEDGTLSEELERLPNL